MLVGWCGYYFIHTCANTLPENITLSNQTWNDLQVHQTVAIARIFQHSCVYIGFVLASCISWSLYVLCCTGSDWRCGHHRASEQGHRANPPGDCGIQLLLGTVPPQCCRWDHTHVHSKLEYVCHSLLHCNYFLFFLFVESLGSSQVWLDAISQNAWDTGTASNTYLDRTGCHT